MNGVIIVNKEKDFTSFDVVAKMRGILKMKKLGHAGTLDPNATGVLPVFIGKATKLCDVLLSEEKVYLAEMLLGIETETEDIWGKVVKEDDKKVTEEEFRKAIFSFIGEYDQVPPMYSAKKVNGKKLYEYARQGIIIERKPEHVFIKNIEILEISGKTAKIRVTCSKGTYIRTLITDIGRRLNTVSVMTSLHREKHGSFRIEDALTLDEIEEKVKNNTIEDFIIPIEDLYPDAKKLLLNESGLKALSNGNRIRADQVSDLMTEKFEKGILYKVYEENDSFKALYTYDDESDEFFCYKMF